MQSKTDQTLKKRNAALKKELAAKKIDLKIEAALEKVRRKAMKMRKSEELISVATVLQKELMKLGVTRFASCGFSLIDEKNKTQKLWGSRTKTNLLEESEIPLLGDSILKARYEAWKQKISVFSQRLSAQRLKKHMEVTYPLNKRTRAEKIAAKDMPDPTFFYFGNFSYGYIMVIATEKLNENETALLPRFAAVFEMTYRRFLDLQKAEAQAREAQIEVALERIRSRTMGMQHSDELREVVAELYTELEKLNFEIRQCVISILNDKEKFAEWWSTGFEDKILPKSFIIPYGNQYIKDFLKEFRSIVKNDIKYRTLELSGKRKKNLDKAIFENTDLKNLPEDIKKEMMSLEKIYLADAFMKYGMLEVVSPSPVSLGKGEILQRFAKVFEQTYTRFLDLQKAEAQAREAQIETALERVRSHSMAMHHSDDLHKVAAILFKQIKELGYTSFMGGIIIYNEKDGSSEYWLSDIDFNIHPVSYRVLYRGHALLLEKFKQWKDGIEFSEIEMSPQVKKSFDRYCLEESGFKHMPEKAKATRRGINKTIYFANAFFKYGVLEAAGLERLNKENASQFQRFAKVFEQTYTRFLDLQKAEAQAKEAKIEAALERVRSTAMAMHSSKDLQKVAEELRRQIGQLDYKDLETCAIHLYDESPDYFVSWAALLSPDSQSDIVLSNVHFPKSGVEVFDEMLKAYHSGKKDYVIINEGKKMTGFLKMLKQYAPQAHNIVLNTFKNFKPKDFRSFWTISDFVGGSLLISTLTQPDVLTRDLLRRFANVFGLAYRRFRDLQKAEAQAREAQIEAALERIRAQSMAMHKSEELVQVVKLIDKEIAGLGIMVDNSNIITDISDPGHGINNWIATKGQNYLEKFHIPYLEHPVTTKFYHAIKKGVNYYSDKYSKSDKDKYFKLLFKYSDFRRAPKKRQKFVFSAPGWSRAVVLSKNSVLVFRRYKLTDFTVEEEEIFKRFGKVFEQAYTRFLDLQKAEEQAREAQIEAALERLRARSMAMHHSRELVEVVRLLDKEIKGLGIQFVDATQIVTDFSES